jgi:CBS domain-containing protein
MNAQLTARDVMQPEVQTVHPEMPLVELDRAFIDRAVGGFPVVDKGQLVGIVSRSDIVRQLYVEQSLAEMVSDYYHQVEMSPGVPTQSLKEIGDEVGERLESLHVKDVMIRKLFTVPATATVQEVARVLADHHIHRVPVTDAGRLVGIITALDLVRLLSEGRATVNR